MHRLPTIALLALVAVGAAACGSGTPSPTPDLRQSAVPGPTPVPVPDPTPVAQPDRTPGASAGPGFVPATITLGNFGEADGPGSSVGDAVANAGTLGRQLVNGILLTEVGGRVWLCDALLTSSPPDCAEPRLMVVNLPPESPTDASGEGHHELGGVRWQDHVQLFGDVRAGGPAAGSSAIPTPLALAPTPPSEPTEFAPPTPVCPAPPNEVQAPPVTVSVGGSAILATNGSSGFLTCSTAGSSDAAPTDPTVGVVAHPGDLLTLTLAADRQILRWEGYDHPAGGEGANAWPAVDSPQRPSHVAVPVPLRSGNSIAGYHLWLVSIDGRAVGGLDILVRVSVRQAPFPTAVAPQSRRGWPRSRWATSTRY